MRAALARFSWTTYRVRSAVSPVNSRWILLLCRLAAVFVALTVGAAGIRSKASAAVAENREEESEKTEGAKVELKCETHRTRHRVRIPEPHARPLAIVERAGSSRHTLLPPLPSRPLSIRLQL
jgi:hypothetical protein